MPRPISTLVHGILDYVTAPTLLTLPHLLKMRAQPTNILRIAGLGLFGYSVMTRYELGVLKLLPMKAHLAMDVASGVALMAAPFIFIKGPYRTGDVLGTFFGFGAFEIAAGLMTQTQPSEAADESPVTNVKNLVTSNA